MLIVSSMSCLAHTPRPPTHGCASVLPRDLLHSDVICLTSHSSPVRVCTRIASPGTRKSCKDRFLRSKVFNGCITEDSFFNVSWTCNTVGIGSNTIPRSQRSWARPRSNFTPLCVSRVTVSPNTVLKCFLAMIQSSLCLRKFCTPCNVIHRTTTSQLHRAHATRRNVVSSYSRSARSSAVRMKRLDLGFSKSGGNPSSCGWIASMSPLRQ